MLPSGPLNDARVFHCTIKIPEKSSKGKFDIELYISAIQFYFVINF